MSLSLMGRKRGMMQLFDESGAVVVCTLIEVEPNVITQVKTLEKDGYQAVQLGFELVTAKDPRRRKARTPKPQQGHFAKHKIEPRRYLAESKVENSASYKVGQEIGVAAFGEVPFVDVTAKSQGKGFQGVMKKYNFRGGPASHGSGFHRRGGSTGMRSTPGWCFPGSPRPSHMGDKSVTVQNLLVVEANCDDNLLILKGPVPGAKGALVAIRPAVKHHGTTGHSGVKLWQS